MQIRNMRFARRKRRQTTPPLDPWTPLNLEPNLIFHLIDEQAKEIHPPIAWYNGRFYYQPEPGVLVPIKDREVLEWWEKRGLRT